LQTTEARSVPKHHAKRRALSAVPAQDVTDLSGAKKAFGSSLPFAGLEHMVHYLTN
jgi:hypothetical protein